MTGPMASLLLSLWCAELTASQLLSCNQHGRLQLNDVSGYFVEERAGRVEICDCSTLNSGCQWKTITVPTGSVTWGWKNAQVACRELYPEDYGVINPILQDTVPDTVRASSLQSVFSYTMNCDGTEARIVDCSWTLSFVTSHARDAYIWCRSSAPIQGDVRLSGSSVSNLVGVVEIYEGRSVGWVTVCSNFWDSGDADVACKQLGYESGTPKSFDSKNFVGPWFGNLSEFFVSCAGFEDYLGDCSFTRMAGCTDSSVRGGVTCIASELPEGSVRLNPPDDVDADDFDRRPEVLYNGRWGSICDDDWDTRDGDVVCQSLGLDSASIDTTPSFRTTGVGRAIWLSSLYCEGTEVNLTLCRRTYPIGYNPFCTNDDDAALECDGGAVDPGGLSIGAVIIGTLIAIVLMVMLLCPLAVFCRKRCVRRIHTHCYDCGSSIPNLCSCPSLPRQLSTRRPAAGHTTNINLVRVTRQRSESNCSANSDGNLAEPGGDFAEQGCSSPPEPSQDTDLRQGAPPSYFDAVRLETVIPVATTDPPQYTSNEQLGDPQSSLPSYPVSTSRSFLPLPAISELPPPQTSNAEASASHFQATSHAVEVHAHSEVVSTRSMPADMNILTSTFQQALRVDQPPPYPPTSS